MYLLPQNPYVPSHTVGQINIPDMFGDPPSSFNDRVDELNRMRDQDKKTHEDNIRRGTGMIQGFGLGALAGGAIGAVGGGALGYTLKWPWWGSALLILLGTAPLGMVAGAMVGASTGLTP